MRLSRIFMEAADYREGAFVVLFTRISWNLIDEEADSIPHGGNFYSKDYWNLFTGVQIDILQ